MKNASSNERWAMVPVLAWIIRMAIVPVTQLNLLDALSALILIGGGILVMWRGANPKDATDALLLLPNDFGVFRLGLSQTDRQYHWIGKTLAELNLRKRDLLVLAVRRGEEVISFPKGPEVITSGDELLIFGRARELKMLNEE